MSTKILHQIVDYDKSASAWGRYTSDYMAITLIKHHDTQADAILAALPQILRDWVSNSPGDPGRLARAACIALDRQAIKSNGNGETQVHSQNGNGTYTVADGRCSCPDWRPERKCKHVLAIEARQIIDTVTITVTLNQTVTGGRHRNIMIHDSKIVSVQEGRGQPRQPRNPQFHTALRWLMDHNYELQTKYWIDDWGGATRRERFHYVQMEATR